MAVDPNIALQAGAGIPEPVAPMDMIGKYVGIGNALAANKLTGVQTQAAEQGLNATRQRAIGTIAMSVLHLPDQQIIPALHSALDRAVSAGVTPRDQAAKYEAGIAQSQDPGHLRRMIAQVGLSTLDPGGQFSQIYGQPQDMSTGQDVQPGVRASPFMGGGFRPSGAAIPQFPSRSELAGRVTGPVGADGQPTTVPLATVTPPNLAGPAAAPMGDGRYTPTGAPGLRNPAAAPPPVTGAVTTGLGPAQTASQSAAGGASATRFQEIADQGVQATSQDALLGNMLTEAAQFTQGPMQDRIKNAQAFALRFAGPIARAFGVDEKSVAANQSFDKMAAQIADAQGAKSDARLAVTQSANPSSSLTPEGADLIIRQLRGNTDYLRARARLAQAYPDKADNAGFETSIGQNLDPRAFQYERMTPEQKSTFYRNLPTEDKATFQRAYGWAREKGLFGNAPR